MYSNQAADIWGGVVQWWDPLRLVLQLLLLILLKVLQLYPNLFGHVPYIERELPRDKSKPESNLCEWALTIQAIWLWPLLGVNFVALQGAVLSSPG